MVKKLRRQTGDFIATGVTLGAGSLAVQQIGGQTAAATGRGLTTFSGFLPAIGTGLGGAAVLRSLKLLELEKKKRRGRL